MATRLYVGNLPYTVTPEELSDLFSAAGTVESVSLPTERETGRRRGFGFVEMSSSEQAENAMRMFDGYELQGRGLRVQIASERPMSGSQRSSGERHRRSA